MAEILLIEDEDEVRELIRINLERDGHVVRETSGGSNVRQLLDGVEVVILDLVLPELDGMDVLREILAFDPYLPLIVLSALVTSKDKIEALDSGAFDYVTKPFDSEELLARVRAAVRVREAHSATKELLRELESDRVIDPATGLLNRRAMEFRLQEECHRIQRGLGPSSVLLVDVEGLPALYEQKGEDAGDRALIRIAQILDSASRRTDIVFRYSGKEFVVLLAGSNADGARVAAERIGKALRRMPVDDEYCVAFSTSVMEVGADDTPSTLIQNARVALIEGRNKSKVELEWHSG